MRKGFTLVELVIVISVLGILASIVLPQLQAHTIQAKEATAKDILASMRKQIFLYKYEHDGLYPGYIGTIPLSKGITFYNQFIGTTKITGTSRSSVIPEGDYKYGPYISRIPENPFNNDSTIEIVPSAMEFTTAVTTYTAGWLYKADTGEFKLNAQGTDSQGESYLDY